MEAAVSAGVRGIAADCGGLLTCATCHVMVHPPFSGQLPPPDGEELAMLAFTATAATPASRLSCQIYLTSALDGLTVELPASQY
jgi:2Fe-2S ferredoxin